MKFIDSALKTFYNCCNLPVCVIDDSFTVLSKCGYTLEVQNTINTLQVLNDINNKFDEMSYDKDIKFLTIPFKLNDITPFVFLIGPFNSEESQSKGFKTLYKSSYIHIKTLLTSILEEKRVSSLHPSISRTISYIHSNYSNPINIEDICEDLNINKCYFCILFKKETGYTFTQFLTLIRIEKSKKLLKNSSLSLMEIALNVGFTNQGYYSTTFKRLTNQTPSEYRACL